MACTACFLHIIKIQVVAERELKIQSEVKEIQKVFYCDLCNKQYKLAMEFEAHLSSYDHNHRKVFFFFFVFSPIDACFLSGLLFCVSFALEPGLDYVSNFRGSKK